MKKKILFLLFLLFLLGAFMLFSQENSSQLNSKWFPRVSSETAKSEGKHFQIYLLTVAPGESLLELYSWWGHAAFIVEDYRSGNKEVYDFGVFSMPENQVLLNFIGGRIDYLVASHSGFYYEAMMNSFLRSGRWTVLQPLHFPPEKAYQIAMYLKENVQPENNVYKYHFFKENCCTKIRDLINYGTEGALYEATKDKSVKSLRKSAQSYLAKSFMANWGLSFLLSSAVDKPCTHWDQMYLPMELMKKVDQLEYSDGKGGKIKLSGKAVQSFPPGKMKALLKRGIASERGVLDGDPTRVREKPSLAWLLALFFGVCVGVVGALFFLLGTKSKVCRILGGIYSGVITLLLFVLSSVLFYMAFFSTHDVTYQNWNLVLINPLAMLLAFMLSIFYAADIGKSRTIYSFFWILVSGLGLVVLSFKLFGIITQDCLMILTALLPWFFFMALSGFFRNRFTKED